MFFLIIAYAYHPTLCSICKLDHIHHGGEGRRGVPGISRGGYINEGIGISNGYEIGFGIDTPGVLGMTAGGEHGNGNGNEIVKGGINLAWISSTSLI